MKKSLYIFFAMLFCQSIYSQELLANVQINNQQIAGSNTQVFRILEKSLRDFINNTSWTGKKLQNFEKIKCNFAVVISERPSNNSFKGSIVVQATRPVFNSQYETPLMKSGLFFIWLKCHSKCSFGVSKERKTKPLEVFSWKEILMLLTRVFFTASPSC